MIDRAGIRILGLAMLAFVSFAADARADDPETWREMLTKPGVTEGTIKAVINDDILSFPNPTELLEETVRPLLGADGPLTGRNRSNVLKHIIYMILEPVEAYPQDRILLADEIVDALAMDQALADEEKLVPKVRSKITMETRTDRQPAWERLLDHAAAILAATGDDAPTPMRIENAIWLLGEGASDVNPSAAVKAISAIADNLQRRLGNDPALRQVSPSVYLDALEKLLWHRFLDLEDANRWLSQEKQNKILKAEYDPDRGRRKAEVAFFTLVRRLKQRPSADRELAIRYGRVAISHAQKPEDLLPFLSECPYPELREVAIRHAATLAPDASRPWVDLIVGVLDKEPTSIEPLLAILFLEPYQQVSEHSSLIVGAIVKRLRDRARVDSIAARKDLVESLTVLGTSKHIQNALQDMRKLVVGAGAADQEPVYTALLRKAGGVSGAKAEIVVPHYFPAEGNSPSDSVRLSVAEALGGKGIRDNKPEAILAAEVLRLILTGSEAVKPELRTIGVPESVVTETSSRVRRVAIENLKHHPSTLTIDLLQRVVLGANESEALLAIGTLGEILDRFSDIGAVQALLEVLGSTDPVPGDEVLIQTIEALAKLPEAANAEFGSNVDEAIVAVIEDDERADDIRLAAASAATQRKFVGALAPVMSGWREAKTQDWRDVMVGLVRTLAADETGVHDGAVTTALSTLGMPAPGRIDKVGFDEAVNLLRELYTMTGRYQFSLALGVLYETRSQQPDTATNQRPKDLEDAIEAFDAATRAADLPEDMRFRTFNRLYSVNIARAEFDDQAEYLLKALEAAASSGERALAEVAADEQGVIPQLDARDDLSEEQVKRKNTAEDTVKRIIG